MRRFSLGLAIGLALGSASSAIAIEVVGSAGVLGGWNVRKAGQSVCWDPFVLPDSREIYCS